MLVDQQVDVGDVRRQLDFVDEDAGNDRGVDREQEAPGVLQDASAHKAPAARKTPLSSRSSEPATRSVVRRERRSGTHSHECSFEAKLGRRLFYQIPLVAMGPRFRQDDGGIDSRPRPNYKINRLKSAFLARSPTCFWT